MSRHAKLSAATMVVIMTAFTTAGLSYPRAAHAASNAYCQAYTEPQGGGKWYNSDDCYVNNINYAGSNTTLSNSVPVIYNTDAYNACNTAGGTWNPQSYDSQAGGGATIIKYYTCQIPTSPPPFRDIGLRVSQASGIVHIAIEPVGGVSKLRIAKGGTIYSVALVPLGDTNATNVHIMMGNGTIMALRACTTAPSNNCQYVP